MKTSKLLMISIFLITISTILLLTLIPILNRQILVINKDIEKLQKKIDIGDSNLLSDSIQRLKMSTTYGTYYILKGLNSTKSSEFDSKLKIQMIESIGGLSNETVNKKELFKKSVNELADILDKKAYEYVEMYNEDMEKINKLKLSKENKETTRDLWIIILGITQSIGLLFGFIFQYNQIKSKK